jgi:hypothetical protein
MKRKIDWKVNKGRFILIFLVLTRVRLCVLYNRGEHSKRNPVR